MILKPGNVMLTKAGTKLLDFGLAKTNTPAVANVSLTALPTEGPGLTAHGTILGTFQYMAPEQIEGQDADARTDIFAFGAVLYEMLTGRKAFTGKTHASLMGAILKDEPPPVSTVQPVAPPALDRIVKTCLAKDPGDRWHTAHDVMLQLKWIAEGGSLVGVQPPIAHRRRHRERVAWGAAAVFAVAFSALVVPSLSRPPAEVRSVRFWVPPNSGTAFTGNLAAPFPAISPDGTRIVFQAQEPGETSTLWVRALDSLEAQPLPGTEGATPVLPFWSPDSRYIGFHAAGKLKKVEATGGPAQVLCDVPSQAEGTWARDGVIVFGNAGGGLFRVSEAGGEPVPITSPSKELKETLHRGPYFLPDGRHFLYLAQSPNMIYAGALDSTEPPKRILEADSRAVYAPPGYLLFVRQGTLMGQHFDLERLELSGDPFPVANNVRVNAGLGRAAFSVSDNGTLVYRTGVNFTEDLRVVWFDRNGKITDDINQSEDNRLPRLSPDERRLVVQRRPSTSCASCTDLWMIDLLRGNNTKVTFGMGDEFLGPRKTCCSRLIKASAP